MKNRKISIKSIENGWLLHWDEVRKWDKFEKETYIVPREKAFTYDFEDEIIGTWKELVKFEASKIMEEYMWIDLYPEEKKKDEKKE